MVNVLANLRNMKSEKPFHVEHALGICYAATA